MLTLKELLAIILMVIILAFSNSFLKFSLFSFLNSVVFFAIILLFYVGAKKLAASYYESEEETKIWSFQRYGMYERSYLKTPVPIGIILPFILSILSLGYIKWFAVTESEVKPTSSRAVRRHDYYSYSEMTEWHLGVISSAGILSMFILSFLAYLINQQELAKLCVYFATFNLIPLGKLDGMKIFFAGTGTTPRGLRLPILWTILIILDIVALFYVMVLG